MGGVPGRSPPLKAAAIFSLSILVVALVPAALAVGSCVAQDQAPELGLESGRLRPCPDSPSCVCSEHAGSEAAVEPLRFQGDPGAAWQGLLELLRGLERVELVTVTDTYAHAIFRSPLFRFPDDVECRLEPAAGAIHVRSASRIGYSDLGANRRRVAFLRERWGAR